ncbi:MAG: hypothetical protein NTX66_03600 [Candidatus Falkowbacteria bacterium]|nr:hypothetical protein [Candidatus Falkowbacteria bacterium]
MFYFSKVYNYLTDFRGNFKKALGAVFSPRSFKVYLILTLIFQALTWYIAYYIYRNLTGDLLILHYNVDFGTDLIGPPSRAFSGPLFGLLIFFVNSGLALFLRAKNTKQKLNFINHLLIAGAMVLNLFLLISLFTIYLNNFR